MAAAASTTPGSTTFTTLGINIQAAADISDESNGWLVQPGLDYITGFSPHWLFNAVLDLRR